MKNNRIPSRMVQLLIAMTWLLAGCQPVAEKPHKVNLAADYLETFAADSATLTAMQQKLDESVTFDCAELPLDVAVRLLSEQLGVEIRLDARSFNELQIDPDTPSSVCAQEVRLRTVLQLLLMSVQNGEELTYAIDGNRIKITSLERVESELRVLFYPCAAFLYDESGAGPDYDNLIFMLTSCIDEESWEELGGPGSISPQSNGVVVAQTDAIHTQVSALLAALNQAKSIASDSYDPTPSFVGSGTQLQPPTAALQVEMQGIYFRKTPLTAVVRMLSEHCKVPIVINAQTLRAEGIALDTPVTDSWNAATAQVILNDILQSLDLTCCHRDDLLEITTFEASERDLLLKVYPLRDLLLLEHPDDDTRESRRIMAPSKSPGIHQKNQRFERLIQTLTTNVQPSSWGEQGGPGALYPVWSADALVIRQSPEIHVQIERLWVSLRCDQQTSPAVDAEPIVAVYSVALDGDAEALQTLSQTLREEIEPHSWDGKSHYVRQLGDRLLIRHRPDVQRQIKQWIMQLLPPPSQDTDGGGYS